MFVKTLSLALVAIVTLAAPHSVGAQTPLVGPDDVIVLFVAGTPPADRDRVIGQAGGVTKRHFRNVVATSARVGAAGRAFLERHPSVEAVIPDREVEKLGRPAGDGSGTAPQVVPAGVTRVGAAPGATAFSGAGVGVAVVDTGIDFAHADLAVAAACFTAYTSCQDDEGHGTHVAGIVAAQNNGIDVVGVASGATLYAVKVLNRRGRGTDSALMAGLDWIAANAPTVSPAIRVVNMSLGRSGTLDDNAALRGSVQALYNAGISIVVAAGNDPGLEVNQQVPATYPEVLAVASTTATGGASGCSGHPEPVAADTASYFTTDGAYDPVSGIGVSVSAPGEDREDISKSCFLKSTGILSTRLGGGTVRSSGTSMSSPHVAGVAALMMEQGTFDPNLGVGPEDIRNRIRGGAAAIGAAPAHSPSGAYSFDGEREGVLSAAGALAPPPTP